MSNINPFGGSFFTPVYTYGMAQRAYEANLPYTRGRRNTKAHPYTTPEGLRKIDFSKGSFEVDL